MKKLLFLWLLCSWLCGSMSAQPLWQSGDKAQWQVRQLTTRDGLASNVVNTVVQDRQGYLWFGTNYGLSRYDGYSFINFYEEHDGLRRAGSVTYIVEDTVSQILRVLFDNTHELRFDLHAMQFRPEVIGSDSVLAPDRRQLDLNRMKAVERGVTSRNLTGRLDNVHYAVTADGREIYTTLDNGFFVWYPDNAVLDHFCTTDVLPLLESDCVTDVLIDHSGSVWLTTYMAGIYRLSPMVSVFQYHKLVTEETDNQQNSIRRFLALDDDAVAVANMNGDVFRYELTKGHSTLLSSSQHRVYALATDRDGRLWKGTRGEGVWVGERHLTEQDGLTGRLIYDIRCAADGTVWIATLDHGLFHCREWSDGSFAMQNYLPDERLHELDIDSRGRVWIASQGGVYVLDGKTIRRIGRQSNVVCLRCTKTDDVLVGSIGNGLLRIRPHGEHFSQHYITTDDGMANNSVKAIMTDHDGNIIVTTDNGVSVIDADGHGIRNLYSSRGLMADAYNENAALCLTDGRILLGSQDGFVELKEVPKPMHNTMPPPTVTCIEVNDEPLLQQDYSNLELKHGQNNLRLDFSSFLYNALESVLYSYWLEGFDKDWKPSTRQPFALYNNLQPGLYRFHVRATVAGGEWSRETVCDIRIASPWWQTWWARLLFLLLFVVLAGYVYFTLRRILRLHNDLQTERQLSAFKMDFFDRMQRELRMPVNVLQGASEQVGTSGASKTTVRNIRMGSKRMLRLLDMLQQFTRLGTMEMQVQAEKDALNEETEARFHEIQQAIHNEEREFRELAPPPLNPQTLLLIEPDDDQRAHLVATLNPYFKVVEAVDYLSLNIEHLPLNIDQADFIVADITSEEKAGLEYVRDLRKQNVPVTVVTLSASTDDALELRCLKAGTDEFLRMPFSGRVLVERLLNRARIGMSNVKSQMSNERPVLSNDPDRRFLDRLEAVVGAQLSDASFNASAMAEKLRVGRTALAQKVRRLTGKSPADYLLERRMQECVRLLTSSDLNIGEIAYRCGFRNQSYFNQKFRERFGCSPRQYNNQE